MPSTLSSRERDRDASSDLMDGMMSAKSSPLLRPMSSHGLGSTLGLNGISIGSSLHTNGNGSGGNGNTNGNRSGGAGVGILINIPSHLPTSSVECWDGHESWGRL